MSESGHKDSGAGAQNTSSKSPSGIEEADMDGIAGGCGDMAAMEAEANRKYADLPPPTGTPPPSGSNRRPKPNKKK